MKYFIVAALFVFMSLDSAFAQSCNGFFRSGQVCNNPTAIRFPPIATSTPLIGNGFKIQPSGGVSIGTDAITTDPGPGRLLIQAGTSTTAYPGLDINSANDCSTGHICSASYMVGNSLTGTSGSQVIWNDWIIANDNVAVPTGANLFGFYIQDNVNGSAVTGSRLAIFGDVEQTVISSNGPNGDYVGVSGVVGTISGEGGTGGQNVYNWFGNYFGANFYVKNQLSTGNIRIATGVEIDNFGLSSSTQFYKFGINVADGNGSTVPTNGWDSALAFYVLNAVPPFSQGRGWQQILSIGDVVSTATQPLASTGTIIGTHLEFPSVQVSGTGYGATATGTLTWNGGNCSTNPVLNVTTSAGGVVTTVNSVVTPGICSVVPPVTANWTAGGGLSGGTGVTINGGLAMTPGFIQVANGIDWRLVHASNNYLNMGGVFVVNANGHVAIADDIVETKSVNGSAGVNITNLNVGASANAGFSAVSNSGQVFLQTSGSGVADGPFSALQSTTPGTFFFDILNATGNMIFRTGNSSTPTTALTISNTQVIGLPSVATGTPVASLCLDAGGNIVKKITTGPCV